MASINEKKMTKSCYTAPLKKGWKFEFHVF